MVFNYDITDPDGYQAYLPAAMPTMGAHGVEVVVADYSSEPKEGKPGQVTIVLKFDSKEAATSWYESDEYRAAMKLRTASSSGSAVLCDGFVMPG